MSSSVCSGDRELIDRLSDRSAPPPPQFFRFVACVSTSSVLSRISQFFFLLPRNLFPPFHSFFSSRSWMFCAVFIGSPRFSRSSCFSFFFFLYFQIQWILASNSPTSFFLLLLPVCSSCVSPLLVFFSPRAEERAFHKGKFLKTQSG